MKLLHACINTLFAACIVTGCKSSSEVKDTGIKGFSEMQEVHLPLVEKGLSLDPRLSSGLAATNVARLLFEGLTYIDENGKIFPGMAKDIQISSDLKSYTFSLREAEWSNGDKVKSSDFEYAWMSALSPEMKAPGAYMLFPIKNAQSYFEGKCSYDDVGIHAMDDKTLVINLESPSPYFLQLTATSMYLPVNQKWAEAHPGFTEGGDKTCVSNGSFKVASFVQDEQLELVKNERYWGNTTVRIDKAHISFMDDQAALASFQKGEVDWVGAPISTLGQAGQETLTESSQLKFAPVAGTQFLRINVAKAPLSSAKFREALMLATDSQSIVTNIMKGQQIPAGALVPPGMGLTEKAPAYDAAEATKLFEEALLDMGMTRNDLPAITLSYISSERMQKIAEFLAQNWKSAFGIDIKLEGAVSSSFYDKLFAEDYQIAAGSWFADYFDPMSFLSVFQGKNNGTNYTSWANPDYTRLLQQSNLEMDPVKRMQLLQMAQDVLMQDLPILPLFHFAFSYGKNDRLKDVTISPMGMVDIDDSYLIDAE